MAKYSWLPFIKFRIPFTRNYIAIHKFDDYFFKTVYEIWYVKNIDDPQDCGHFCYDDPADCLEEAGELGEDSDNWECFKEHNHKEARRIQVAHYNWVNEEKGGVIDPTPKGGGFSRCFR